VVLRRGRRKTVCARGAWQALLGGPSTSPLGGNVAAAWRLCRGWCSSRVKVDEDEVLRLIQLAVMWATTMVLHSADWRSEVA